VTEHVVVYMCINMKLSAVLIIIIIFITANELTPGGSSYIHIPTHEQGGSLN
jgi:hypothetical protein